MLTVYDIAWRALLSAAAPLVALSPKFRRKAARALRERVGFDVPAAAAGERRPCVMIHAVSLGEMNATRALVTQLLAARPDLRFLVTVTTDTGFARGRELYGNDPAVTLARYPLDLSPAIERLLDRQRPAVVVLMELEVWPNFVLHCDRRGIPVALVNGRLTKPSFRQYRLARPVLGRSFARLAAVCAQDEEYAGWFRALGARLQAVSVTGTMKFDTAQVADRIPGDADLARDLGLLPKAGPLWVCGSTGPGEEAIALSAYRTLLASHPTLRLAVIPRHPERFDAVADLIERSGFPVLRRSRNRPPLAASQATADPTLPPPASASPVVLGDTMGELRKFYALADVVLVGRSLVDLGSRQRGSDMIEPAALAKPVVIGKWTHNFADAVRALKAADGIREIASPADLAPAVDAFLRDPSAAAETGRKARRVVLDQQGATARHVAVVLALLAGHG
ncbi:MAG TPA: 3-deoxy-D-manno-octulosonic acid transferase [Humisphaera sp.]